MTTATFRFQPGDQVEITGHVKHNGTRGVIYGATAHLVFRGLPPQIHYQLRTNRGEVHGVTENQILLIEETDQ